MTTESRLAARDRVTALAGYFDDHDGLNFLDALDDFERESRSALLAAAKAALRVVRSTGYGSARALGNLRAAVEQAEGDRA